MLDYTYKDFQLSKGDLNLEEFIDLIWNDNVSEKIVSNEYYNDNEDFILAFTYDCYRLFQNSNISIRIVSRMIESFFFNLFRYNSISN